MDARNGLRAGALWILAVSLCHFAGDMYPAFVTPLLPYFKRVFPSDYLANSLLVAAGNAGLALQPAFGILADRVRHNWLIAGGVICSAIFYSLTTVMPSFALVAAAILLGAAGVSAFHPQSAALAGKLGGADPRRAMGVFIAGGQVGVAVGMLAAPLVVDLFGARWLPALMPVGLVAGLSALLVPVSAGGRPDRERAPEARLFRQASRVAAPFAALTLFVILRAFVINGFCFALPHLAYGVAKGESLGLVRAAVPVALFVLSGTAGILSGGRLAAVLGERRLLAASSLAGAAMCGAFLLTEGWASYVMLAAAGAALSATVPLHVVLGQRLLPDNASAASSLTIGVGWGVGGMLVPLLGYAADRLGSIEGALWAVAGVSAATTALAFAVPADRTAATSARDP